MMRDPEVVQYFKWFRITVTMLLVGLALLWASFAGFVTWRLFYAGYDINDAQNDRSTLCLALDLEDCPDILKYRNNNGNLETR